MTTPYRRGFNDPIEGAKRYLELHSEIAVDTMAARMGVEDSKPPQTPQCVCGEIEAHPCHSVEWCMSGIVGAHQFTPKAGCLK